MPEEGVGLGEPGAAVDEEPEQLSGAWRVTGAGVGGTGRWRGS